MEHQLIQAAQKGDSDAFLSLLAQYDRQVMSVVYRFTGDQYDREDLYQEVFISAFKSIKSYRFKARFGTWLYRIALNRCVDYMRKKPPVAEVLETATNSEDHQKRARLRSIHQALSKLKGPQRICFHLYYIEEWNLADLAELLGCKPGTIKSHLNRAKEKIRNDQGVRIWQMSPN